MDALFSDILSNFWLGSEPVSCGPFGCGHVNKTYLAVTRSGHRYIMQMIGPAFKDVHALQDNIRAVTEHLTTITTRQDTPGGYLSLSRTVFAWKPQKPPWISTMRPLLSVLSSSS